jgi:excisionase family DNA binding protein
MQQAVLVEPRYISLAQASAIVNVCPRTLRRAIAAGSLVAYRLGRRIRIELAELHRWVRADGAAGVRTAGRRAA